VVNKHEVPTILSVCKESREVAKDTYRLCFKKELEGKKIWVDFFRDTVIFRDLFALLAFYGFEKPSETEDNLEELKSNLPQETTVMEKELRFLIIGSSLGKPLIEVLSRFQSLQKVLLEKKSMWTAGFRRKFLGYDNLDHLESEMMDRWSALEGLPYLEQWDEKDLRGTFWESGRSGTHYLT
jgi:benzoyl-CoA reductase/2-hydroxyglutaryl-CoA dehydratase subunit BcrC/BadD/HgdB